jgi:Tfp pilus assembly protein PilO
MKKNLNLQNLNLQKLNLKNNSLYTYFFLAIVIYLVVIAYISSIIYYLNNLKKCSCFNNSDVNLTYLIVIESIILTLNIITTVLLILAFIMLNNVKSGGGNSNVRLYIIITLIIQISILGYFVYNVYKLSKNIDENCNCSKDWLRYLLYIQSIIMLFSVIFNIYALFLLFI